MFDSEVKKRFDKLEEQLELANNRIVSLQLVLMFTSIGGSIILFLVSSIFATIMKQ